MPLNLHKGAKVNEGPHPTSLRSATFPIGEGKAVERLRSKPAFPFGEGARRADEVFVRLSSLKRINTEKDAWPKPGVPSVLKKIQ